MDSMIDHMSSGKYKKAVETLLIKLNPRDFNQESTAFHMGYEQAKTDFRRILENALKTPTA